MFSPSQFNALLTDLVNDSDNTMDVLYNAMGAVVDIEKKVKEIGQKREYFYKALEEVETMKRRHVEYLQKEIEACERMRDTVDAMSTDDGDVIRRVLYRPRQTASMMVQGVSANALQSITNTLQQAEEEEKRRKQEEEEKKRAEEEKRRVEEELRERKENGIVLNTEELNALPVNAKKLWVKKCDDYQNEVLDLSRFAELEELTIGDGCFNYVSKVSVVELKKLKSVAIGTKSFQNESNDSELVVSDCPELTSLIIGNESFKGFKEMTLSGLDGLKRVVMGVNCFKNAELRVSGLKELETLSLGGGCFEKSLHSVIEGD